MGGLLMQHKYIDINVLTGFVPSLLGVMLVGDVPFLPGSFVGMAWIASRDFNWFDTASIDISPIILLVNLF